MTQVAVQSGDTVLAGALRLTLGQRLKSGGAGSIFLVPEAPESVAKIYHPHMDRALAERRIDAMLRLRPDLPDVLGPGQRQVQLAWPTAPLRDRQGRFQGFLMPIVDLARSFELEYVLQDKQAQRAGLHLGLGAKVTLMANLSAVVHELHSQGHCVVDMKPVNLRFYQASLSVAMLDCDGFSIHGGHERFAATQITPEYLAPEFHLKPMSSAAAEEQQDRFALAVMVFQVLNHGIHPFAGRPLTEIVPTDIPSRIRGRWYPHGLERNTRILPPPGSGHEAMPLALRSFFDRALAGSVARPTAAEWAKLLRPYALRAEGSMVACAAHPTRHQHFAGLPCGACAREALLDAATHQASARKVTPARRTARAATATPSPSHSAPISAPASAPHAAPAPSGWPAGRALGSTGTTLWASGWVPMGFMLLFIFIYWSRPSEAPPPKPQPAPVQRIAASESSAFVADLGERYRMDSGSWQQKIDQAVLKQIVNERLLPAAAQGNRAEFTQALAVLEEAPRVQREAPTPEIQARLDQLRAQYKEHLALAAKNPGRGGMDTVMSSHDLKAILRLDRFSMGTAVELARYTVHEHTSIRRGAMTPPAGVMQLLRDDLEAVAWIMLELEPRSPLGWQLLAMASLEKNRRDDLVGALVIQDQMNRNDQRAGITYRDPLLRPTAQGQQVLEVANKRRRIASQRLLLGSSSAAQHEPMPDWPAVDNPAD